MFGFTYLIFIYQLDFYGNIWLEPIAGSNLSENGLFYFSLIVFGLYLALSYIFLNVRIGQEYSPYLIMMVNIIFVAFGWTSLIDLLI